MTKNVGDAVVFSVPKQTFAVDDVAVLLKYIDENRQERKFLVFDFKKVKDVEDAAIRRLEEGVSLLCKAGNQVRFVGLNRIRRTDTATKLAQLGGYYPDEAAAVRSFG